MAKSVGMICFVAAVLFSGCCLGQTIVGPDGKPLRPAHQAKCKSPTGCYEQATRDCRGGSYQILDSESHAGGLLIDILPGPVTWYGMSYAHLARQYNLSPHRETLRRPPASHLFKNSFVSWKSSTACKKLQKRNLPRIVRGLEN